MKHFSPKFNSRLLMPASIGPLGQICKFSKIQDGDGRHLEFRKALIVSANIKQFSPNFNSVHLALAKIDPWGQKCKFSKIQDGGGRHLEFHKNVHSFRKY